MINKCNKNKSNNFIKINQEKKTNLKEDIIKTFH